MVAKIPSAHASAIGIEGLIELSLDYVQSRESRQLIRYIRPLYEALATPLS